MTHILGVRAFGTQLLCEQVVGRGLRRRSDLTVHLNGVDVYDPTTGQIRSSTTDDVARWFIDTDYDSQSFFVRQAYFTGAK